MSAESSTESSREVSPSSRQMRSLSPFIEVKDNRQVLKKNKFKKFLSKLDILNLMDYNHNFNKISISASPQIKNEASKHAKSALTINIIFYSLIFLILAFIIT